MSQPSSVSLANSTVSVTAVSLASTAGARLAGLARSGLVWGMLAAIALTTWILYGLGGAHYYGTDLSVRAYEPAHRLLRPSGPLGQSFGLFGTVMMLVPFAYVARKRVKALRNLGSVKAWLEVHLFCGIVGPVLVTFHTSFKFNGIISAAYWSMVIVVLSGFAGRQLYVRIPRSIKGNELSRADLEARATDLKHEIGQYVADASVLRQIDAFEARLAPSRSGRSFFHLFFGELSIGRKVRAFERDLASSGVPERMRRDLTRLSAERALVLLRAEDLQRTRQLFQLWHVFHLPLVYLLLAIATLHIGLTLYMGYVPFRW